MKFKKIFFLIIFMLVVLLPLKVSALSTGDCITHYGSISLKLTNSNNKSGGGQIVKPNVNFSEWSTDVRSFEIDVQSSSKHKVESVEYTIQAGNGTCTGEITGSDLLKNEGNVILGVTINKGLVKNITFVGNTVARNDSSEKAKTPSLKLDINHEEYKDQKKEYSSSDFGDLTPGNVDLCDDGIMSLIDKYWSWIMFLAPLLLLVMMTIDFLKAMAANDADAIKKSSNNAIKRTIATLVLLALPWILRTIFAMFGIDKVCF